MVPFVVFLAARNSGSSRQCRAWPSGSLTLHLPSWAEIIENPEVDMTLRQRSHLLLGLSKIYTKKVQVLGLLALPHSG